MKHAEHVAQLQRACISTRFGAVPSHAHAQSTFPNEPAFPRRFCIILWFQCVQCVCMRPEHCASRLPGLAGPLTAVHTTVPHPCSSDGREQLLLPNTLLQSMT